MSKEMFQQDFPGWWDHCVHPCSHWSFLKSFVVWWNVTKMELGLNYVVFTSTCLLGVSVWHQPTWLTLNLLTTSAAAASTYICVSPLSALWPLCPVSFLFPFTQIRIFCPNLSHVRDHTIRFMFGCLNSGPHPPDIFHLLWVFGRRHALTTCTASYVKPAN